MTPFEDLCQCFAEQSTSCCAVPSPPPAAPIPIDNLPGQAAIRYRIGAFTSFRQAMLDQLAKRVKGDSGPSAVLPDGPVGDYQTMFVELWAYLADVLTFYQERIANEAFLQTATQRDSLLRLCRLINYRPNPGAGASALLAFTVEKNKSVLIPAGFRTGNKPAPGKDPAVFETESAYTAIGLHSAIPMASAAPTNQFASLRDYELLAKKPTAAEATRAAAAIYPLASDAYLKSFISSSLVQATTGGVASLAGTMSLATPNAKVTRPIVLKGTNAGLSAGAYVLVVESEDDNTNENATLRQLNAISIDKATNSTTIYWSENADVAYAEKITVYALRITASAFGSNAPDWNTLSPTLTNRDGRNSTAPFQDYWDDLGNTKPLGVHKPDLNIKLDPRDLLCLDSIYPNAKRSTSHPDWVVLLTEIENAKGKTASPESPIFRVLDTSLLNKTGFTIAAKVTCLKLSKQIPPEKSVYPRRTTVVLTGAERLVLQDDLPLPVRLAGDTLILAGRYESLQPGQQVLVHGKRIDANTSSDTPTSEAAILKTVNPTSNITTIVLQEPLQATYTRASTVLLANVVSATQGETVRDEVLGSGNGSAFQTFALKKKPLTYLPSADSEGLSAVKSTLGVTVNGVRWTERPTLFETRADAQEYTTIQDEAGHTTVIFGDGVFGAKPPTGRDNIRARYRKGMGINGNVSAGGIAQLLDNIAGLQKVANPLPAQGGLDQERIDRIRSNAPASLRTFGQAVSTRDYADLALIFPGVAKASAAWVVKDPHTGKSAAQPHVQLTVALADQVKLAEQPSFAQRLREFLDRRRDPNVPLRVTDGTPIYIDVAVRIAVDDRYPRQATLDRVQAALSPIPNPDGLPGYFSFERLQFGQSISLSELFHAIHDVEGVRFAVISKLQRHEPIPSIVEPADILVGPTELIVLRNDPAEPTKGTLTVTHLAGGFVDT